MERIFRPGGTNPSPSLLADYPRHVSCCTTGRLDYGSTEDGLSQTFGPAALSGLRFLPHTLVVAVSGGVLYVLRTVNVPQFDRQQQWH